MTDPDLTVYELEGCPYCAKVRRALEDLELSYDSVSFPGPVATETRSTR